MGTIDWIFVCGLGASWYAGAPKWALLLVAVILVGIRAILGAMTAVGREADRQIADIKSQLRALREPSASSAYDYDD